MGISRGLRRGALCLLLFAVASCDAKPGVGEDEPDARVVADGEDDASDAGQPPDVEPDARVPEPFDDAGSDASAPEPEPRAAWTVLVYMAADNNLEKFALDDLSEMLAAESSDDVNVLVQIDRASGFYDLGLGQTAAWESMKRFRVRTGVLEEVADLGERNTGDPETLADFVSWGFRSYPAERRMLVLWNHGNAWRGYGGDEASDHDMLDQPEIGQAITTGLRAADVPQLDMLGFDACLMSNVATAKMMSAFTRYFVASEELEPGHGWDYQGVLSALANDSSLEPVELGKAVIEAFYQQARKNKKQRDVTLSLLDLSKFDAVQAALASLLGTLRSDLPSYARDIAHARAKAVRYGYHADPKLSHHMLDLGDFAAHLAAEDARLASHESVLRAALAELVVDKAYGSEKAASKGLSVYFPTEHPYYERGYDDVMEAREWREFLAAYFDMAEAHESDGVSFHDDQGGIPTDGQELPHDAEASCDPRYGPTVKATLSAADAADVASAEVLGGFVETRTGQAHVFVRERAHIDPVTHEVTGHWDRHVVVAHQGALQVPLFAEVNLADQDRTVYAEIPLVYTEPASCACAHEGAPGYSDVDGDGMPDCGDDDVDADGIADKRVDGGVIDNCPWVPNADQADTDGDGIGDACEGGSRAPRLRCVPEAAGEFGKSFPAMGRVVIDRHHRTHESTTFYMITPGGTSELTPEPGGLLWPRRIVVSSTGHTSFRTDPPLPFNLHREISFDYADAEALFVQNEAGGPLLDGNLEPTPLLASLGMDHLYLHLELDDFRGQGDVAHVRGDLSHCDPAPLDLCPGDEHPDCTGACFPPSAFRPDGVCSAGQGAGIDLNCALHDFDDGECARPRCAAGYVRDCNGQCSLAPGLIGDGECNALAACGALAWDGGDCACGPNCNDHGVCSDQGCACTGGYTGPFCSTPPSCGNGSCEAAQGENCLVCAGDCGSCAPACGDGACSALSGESCDTCEADCGACRCGDGVCAGAAESCDTCAADCGHCPTCGDLRCDAWHETSPFPKEDGEHCANCPGDCGHCTGECCVSTDEEGELESRLGCGDHEVASCVCDALPECCTEGWSEDCEVAALDCGMECHDCAGLGHDVDEDGVCGHFDACPGVADDQRDADGDTVGDACDVCPDEDDRVDVDRDGVPDACDLCPRHPDLTQVDADADGVGDACDSCPSVPNADRDPRACAEAIPDGCSPELCGDAVDQDCDDVADEGCVCVPAAEICGNRIDEDCDRLVDERPCSR